MYQMHGFSGALIATGNTMASEMIERRRTCVLALQRGPDSTGQIWVGESTSLDEYIVGTRSTTSADSYFYGVPRFDLIREISEGLVERPGLMTLTPEELTIVGVWERMCNEAEDLLPPPAIANNLLTREEGARLHEIFKEYCWNGEPAYGEYIAIGRCMQRAVDLATWEWGIKTHSTRTGDRLEKLIGKDDFPSADTLRRVARKISSIDGQSLSLLGRPTTRQWLLHPRRSLARLNERSQANEKNNRALKKIFKEEGLPALFAYGQGRRER